jgi:hypothetical protein
VNDARKHDNAARLLLGQQIDERVAELGVVDQRQRQMLLMKHLNG